MEVVSWVAINRVISRITRVITYIRGLITPLITTHEPPNRVEAPGSRVAWAVLICLGGFGLSFRSSEVLGELRASGLRGLSSQ